MATTLTIADAVEHVAATPCPVAMLDTCAILDVIRAPIRGNASIIKCATNMLRANTKAKTSLHIITTKLVATEFADNINGVRKDLETNIKKTLNTINEINAAYEYTFPNDSPPYQKHDLDEFISEIVTIATRILMSSIQLEDNLVCEGRALSRNVKDVPPTRKGSSVKDCHITEHFVEFSQLLRAAGVNDKLAFVTSNTKDYCPDGRRELHPEIRDSFPDAGFEFAPNLCAAIGVLGL